MIMANHRVGIGDYANKVLRIGHKGIKEGHKDNTCVFCTIAFLYTIWVQTQFVYKTQIQFILYTICTNNTICTLNHKPTTQKHYQHMILYYTCYFTCYNYFYFPCTQSLSFVFLVVSITLSLFLPFNFCNFYPPQFALINSITMRSNSFSDVDPFEVPEKYYNSSSRTRTLSVVETNSQSKYSFPDMIAEGSRENSESRDPSPDKSEDKSEDNESELRRPSIIPLYDSSASTAKEANSTSDLVKVENEKNKSFHLRRSSLDDAALHKPKKFFINDIDLTLRQLLKNEDTDHNHQITIEDSGPKVLKLGTANSNGFNQFDIRGTYMLSNLLQELTIAKRLGKTQLFLDEQRLNENPVSRMKRLIRTQFWPRLTRQLTKHNIVDMTRDTKIREDYVNEDGELVQNQESHRVYIPHSRQDQYNYFMGIKKSNPQMHLDVRYLPETIDAKFIRSINKMPGLLSLAADVDPNDATNMINQPYIVPGGRFNELYGWDSYMETLGLLVDATVEDKTNLTLARGMTENFIYEITYYGKILNANRSYYLGRSQPPFLTDMALRVFNKMVEIEPESMNEAIGFLNRAVKAAIKEYKTIWMSSPRYNEETGLSCYHAEGLGVPPETEASHFLELLKPYREKYNVSHEKFIEMYNNDEVNEPELDNYFVHDRAVRESGHDTSYRLEGKCADIATVDLNALLYKYEVDIAFIIDEFFGNKLELDDGTIETKDFWLEKSHKRQENISKYLWNEADSIFYDYNVKTHKQTGYESATALWPLWSKVATQEQAQKLVVNSLWKFEEFGGLVAGTEKSRGAVNLDRPSRQWDYPYGWAPQQIMAWIGLSNYGFQGSTRRLVYRWLYLMTKAFADYNGVVVEKYNVVEGAAPHKVDAEYGNQGADFKGVATEGFGWVNASYLFGLTFLNLHAIRNLGTLTPPKVFLENMHEDQRKMYT